jgi:hypothetical protein
MMAKQPAMKFTVVSVKTNVVFAAFIMEEDAREFALFLNGPKGKRFAVEKAPELPLTAVLGLAMAGIAVA